MTTIELNIKAKAKFEEHRTYIEIFKAQIKNQQKADLSMKALIELRMQSQQYNSTINEIKW